MSDEAFLYYLPALLLMSLADEEDVDLSGKIMTRFVAIQADLPKQDRDGWERVQLLTSSLSELQRTALSLYFDWVDRQGWQYPGFAEAAKDAVLRGVIAPVPTQDVTTWLRDRYK